MSTLKVLESPDPMLEAQAITVNHSALGEGQGLAAYAFVHSTHMGARSWPWGCQGCKRSNLLHTWPGREKCSGEEPCPARRGGAASTYPWVFGFVTSPRASVLVPLAPPPSSPPYQGWHRGPRPLRRGVQG